MTVAPAHRFVCAATLAFAVAVSILASAREARAGRRWWRRSWITPRFPAVPRSTTSRRSSTRRLGYPRVPHRRAGPGHRAYRISRAGARGPPRMAGRHRRGDWRAGVSVAHRRLRRADPRHGFRPGPSDSTDGGDRGENRPTPPPPPDSPVPKVTASAAERATSGGPAPEPGRRSFRCDRAPRRHCCAGGRRRGGRHRPDLRPGRCRSPVRDGGLVARRGRARRRGQRSVDDASGGRSRLLARADSRHPGRAVACAALSACVPSARPGSSGWSDRASISH